jgi:riboflavin-specific deaminase-like protein
MDAVMVGAGTVLADDPQLNVRHVRGRDPRPMVVDGRLRVDPAARVFQQPGAVLITSTTSSAARRRLFSERGVAVWTFDTSAGRIPLAGPLRRAAGEGITSVLLEGGGELAAAALRDRVVDRVQVFLAPRLLGTGVAAVGDLGVNQVEEGIALREVRTRRLAGDLLYTARVEYPCSPD